nr:PREDICTED: ly6/PLAUR domain-containing protein 8 [Anolis carolinensis]|eukprot:XP_016850281.1 PREDICTED: ly6/PLAUR domain-containing protein 8 [Anolis carolinensis]
MSQKYECCSSGSSTPLAWVAVLETERERQTPSSKTRLACLASKFFLIKALFSHIFTLEKNSTGENGTGSKQTGDKAPTDKGTDKEKNGSGENGTGSKQTGDKTPTDKGTDKANSMITCECNSGDNLCSKDRSCIIEKGDCIAIAFNNTLDGKDIKKVYLGCQPKSVSFDQCHEENIFITAGKDFYLNSQAKCCHSKDKCNNDLKLVTKESDKTSEMKCPSCFALSPESCNATKTNCFKDQNRCINITGKLMNETGITAFELKGCTTAFTASILQETGAMLDYGDTIYSIDTIQVGNGKLSSIQAPPGIVFAVLLPSLLGLLLDKFLY